MSILIQHFFQGVSQLGFHVGTIFLHQIIQRNYSFRFDIFAVCVRPSVNAHYVRHIIGCQHQIELFLSISGDGYKIQGNTGLLSYFTPHRSIPVQFIFQKYFECYWSSILSRIFSIFGLFCRCCSFTARLGIRCLVTGGTSTSGHNIKRHDESSK